MLNALSFSFAKYCKLALFMVKYNNTERTMFMSLVEFKNVYIQELESSSEEFIPDFDLQGV